MQAQSGSKHTVQSGGAGGGPGKFGLGGSFGKDGAMGKGGFPDGGKGGFGFPGEKGGFGGFPDGGKGGGKFGGMGGGFGKGKMDFVAKGKEQWKASLPNLNRNRGFKGGDKGGVGSAAPSEMRDTR